MQANPIMVAFPFGYRAASLVPAQTLFDLSSYAAVKMAEGDVRGLVGLVQRMRIPEPLHVPAIFQLGIGYGLAHGLPLPEENFLRLIGRLLNQDDYLPMVPPDRPVSLLKECILMSLRSVVDVPFSEGTSGSLGMIVGGSGIILGVRDCTLQREQKVIEMSDLDTLMPKPK